MVRGQLDQNQKSKSKFHKDPVKRVSWTDLRPIEDLEDHLTQMEKKNGKKWNGRWTQPNYEDVLNILLPSS